MKGVPNWSERTILVVEDEEINRFFFQSALRITKAKLIFAENGLKGIEIATHNQEIDCVLMDVRMPIVNGYDATKTIKKKRKHLPIIIQTAYTLSSDRIKAIESGCDEFIAKPITIDLLYEVISKYFNQPGE